MKPRNRRGGFALLTTIFAMVVIGLITAAAFAMSDVEGRIVRDHVDAAAARRLVQMGEIHARSLMTGPLLKDTSYTRLLRGWDDNPTATDDNGILAGYPGLGDSLAIPATGRVVPGVGRYFVTVIDDPKDSDGLPFVDSNSRVVIRVRGVTDAGSSAEAHVVVGNFSLPAIAIGGNLTVAAKTNVQGACGGIHANGNIDGSSDATVATTTSATGTITHTSLRPGLPGSPPVQIPDLTAFDFCTGPDVIFIGATWKPKLSAVTPGKTYCINGNLELTGDVSTPVQATFITSGYLQTSGSGFNHLVANHADGFVLLAGGDLIFGGNGKFTGIVYAGGQCEASAAVTLVGQLLCLSKTPHPGDNKITVNKLSGNSTFIFDCNSSLSSGKGVLAWYPVVGS
jgi:hypothetical protein